jgi:hypothetical protein
MTPFAAFLIIIVVGLVSMIAALAYPFDKRVRAPALGMLLVVGAFAGLAWRCAP